MGSACGLPSSADDAQSNDGATSASNTGSRRRRKSRKASKTTVTSQGAESATEAATFNPRQVRRNAAPQCGAANNTPVSPLTPGASLTPPAFDEPFQGATFAVLSPAYGTSSSVELRPRGPEVSTAASTGTSLDDSDDKLFRHLESSLELGAPSSPTVLRTLARQAGGMDGVVDEITPEAVNALAAGCAFGGASAEHDTTRTAPSCRYPRNRDGSINVAAVPLAAAEDFSSKPFFQAVAAGKKQNERSPSVVMFSSTVAVAQDADAQCCNAEEPVIQRNRHCEQRAMSRQVKLLIALDEMTASTRLEVI